jgi:hypothetical protein
MANAKASVRRPTPSGPVKRYAWANRPERNERLSTLTAKSWPITGQPEGWGAMLVVICVLSCIILYGI